MYHALPARDRRNRGFTTRVQAEFNAGRPSALNSCLGLSVKHSSSCLCKKVLLSCREAACNLFLRGNEITEWRFC